MADGKCRIGTSGWVYGDWKGIFYPADLPQSRWFEYYAREFDTVEINNSFYRLPAAETFDGWRKQAPEGFVYAVKANRYLTHLKKLKETGEPLERFLSRARRLGPTLGPILWQLPPRWHSNAERLASFADALPTDLTHVFEFRDPSWFNGEIRGVLEAHGLAFCIFHMPDLPCPSWVTSQAVYLRFHGSGTVYGGLYGREALAPWAERIRTWLASGHDVYAYFNNDTKGYALEDARELRRQLAEG